MSDELQDKRDLVLAAYRELEANRRFPMFVEHGPNTVDYPGHHVARLWATSPEPAPTNMLIRASTMAEVRDLLPAGLVLLSRYPDDEPSIVGVWM